MPTISSHTWRFCEKSPIEGFSATHPAQVVCRVRGCRRARTRITGWSSGIHVGADATAIVTGATIQRKLLSAFPGGWGTLQLRSGCQVDAVRALGGPFSVVATPPPLSLRLRPVDSRPKVGVPTGPSGKRGGVAAVRAGLLPLPALPGPQDRRAARAQDRRHARQGRRHGADGLDAEPLGLRVEPQPGPGPVAVPEADLLGQVEPGD